MALVPGYAYFQNPVLPQRISLTLATSAKWGTDVTGEEGRTRVKDNIEKSGAGRPESGDTERHEAKSHADMTGKET